jgi:hypothetical protein
VTTQPIGEMNIAAAGACAITASVTRDISDVSLVATASRCRISRALRRPRSPSLRARARRLARCAAHIKPPSSSAPTATLSSAKIGSRLAPYFALHPARGSGGYHGTRTARRRVARMRAGEDGLSEGVDPKWGRAIEGGCEIVPRTGGAFLHPAAVCDGVRFCPRPRVRFCTLEIILGVRRRAARRPASISVTVLSRASSCSFVSILRQS